MLRRLAAALAVTSGGAADSGTTRSSRLRRAISTIAVAAVLTGCSPVQARPPSLARVGPYLETLKLLTTNQHGWTSDMSDARKTLDSEDIPYSVKCVEDSWGILVPRLFLDAAHEALRKAGSKVWIAPVDSK